MTAIDILFSVGCICIGAFAFVSGVKTVMKCKSKTVGRITGISESEDRDRENQLTIYYSPEFEYEVDGQIYHGTGDTSYEHYKKLKSVVISRYITIPKIRKSISQKAVEYFQRFLALVHLPSVY